MANMRRNSRSGGQHSERRGGKNYRSSRELVRLYEDDFVVAIDKPAGLAAVPVKGSDAPSAWSLLSAELRRKRQRAFVVHRIDRFTSGIMLFAKTEPDRDALVRNFLRTRQRGSIWRWFAAISTQKKEPWFTIFGGKACFKS